jgi:hypothetical protein
MPYLGVLRLMGDFNVHVIMKEVTCYYASALYVMKAYQHRDLRHQA